MRRINGSALLHATKSASQITQIRPSQPHPPTKHTTNSSSNLFDDLIRGFSKEGLPKDALLTFRLMRQQGVKPRNYTYPFVVKASASLTALTEGKQVHADALKHGLHGSVYVGNSLIHFYGCCADVCSACKVFDEMPVRTLVSWNTVIKSCVDNSRFQDALGLFTSMMSHGVDPDETTMVGLLSGCAELSNLSLGKRVHCHVAVKGLTINSQLGTALVSMYAKCGNLDYATLIFNQLCDRNIWTYSSMILGLAQHGSFTKALNLYSKMISSTSISPNYVTFLGVLCACSHGGLIDEGYKYFHEMEHVYGIKPTLPHYGAMVDMLCRAGFLNEAYSFIKNMRVEPDAVVWRTLLSACNLHRVDHGFCGGLAAEAMEKLMELEPERAGNFVIVGNKCLSVGMWEEGAAVRSSSLGKIAGESCVEIQGLLHRFVSGNGSSKHRLDMCWVLDALNLHMKKVN